MPTLELVVDEDIVFIWIGELCGLKVGVIVYVWGVVLRRLQCSERAVFISRGVEKLREWESTLLRQSEQHQLSSEMAGKGKLSPTKMLDIRAQYIEAKGLKDKYGCRIPDCFVRYTVIPNLLKWPRPIFHFLSSIIPS